MSDILRKRLIESKGKKGKVFLKNGFRYVGRFGDSDNTYLEFFDRIVGLKVIRIDDISDIEINNPSERENGKERQT